MCNWGQPTRPKCTRVFSRETRKQTKNSDRVTNKTLQNINIKQKRKQNTANKTMLEANEAIHVSFK